MSKATIKADIDANITQNGTGAITGNILNGVLNGMVDDSYDNIDALHRDIEGQVQNYVAGKFLWYTYGENTDENWFFNSEYIPCNYGDVVVWQYGTTKSNACLVIYDSDKNILDYWTANNSSGYRSLTISSSSVANAAFVRASFYLPMKSTAALSINGVEVFTPIEYIPGAKQGMTAVGTEYDNQNTPFVSTNMQELPMEMYNKLLPRGQYTRLGQIVVTGGSFINFNRQTKEITIPGSASVICGGSRYAMSAAQTIVLSHNYGIIVYNTTSGLFRDAWQTPPSAEDDFVAFVYNTALGGYINSLVSSLPNNSLRYDNGTPNITDILQGQDLGSLFASAKYDFPNQDGVLPLQLLWMSDLHKYEQGLIDFLKIKANVSSFDDAIATGDQQEQHYEDDFSWWGVDGASSVLQVIGNHEVWKNDGTYATSAEAYNKYFLSYIDGWNVQSAGVGKCYWYKDYQTSKIRLIALDCMNWDLTQKTWFESVLSDAKNNELAVIVAQHYLADTPDIIKCNYSSIIYPNLQGIISADAPNAVDDFISNGGHFICWLGGHYHADYIYKLQNHPNQYGILIGTASRSQREENNYRGTHPVRDLFSAIQFDTKYKTIKMIRIGAFVDRWMRNKRLVSFNYETGDVICGY